MSTFDRVYRSALPMKFFTKGWGNPETVMKLIENIKTVSKRERFLETYKEPSPIVIDKKSEHKQTIIIEGSFTSPLSRLIPDAMDAQNSVARFQAILPKEWSTNHRPMCIQFAGTGDHKYYRRRQFLANQLLEDGIGSIIVMNPFYWKRKPSDQNGSRLNYVSDLFVMGGALILECHTLLNWCEARGYGPLALHGISMGGYMASLCATVYPKPISLIPCLSWSTASVVFVEGIMSTVVDWNTLNSQYYSDSVYANVIRPLIQPSVPSQYQCLATEADPYASPLKSNSSSEDSSVPQSVKLTRSGNKLVRSPSTNLIPSNPTLSAERILNRFSSGLDLLSLPLGDSKYFSFLNFSLWHSGASLIRSFPESLTSSSNRPDPEVRQFMRELLDYFTHLGNFSPVIDPHLVLAVAAQNDAYVPRQGVTSLTKLYPGAEVRLLPQSGHVGAYVRNVFWTKDFRRAIVDCINRQLETHHNERSLIGSTQLQTTTSVQSLTQSPTTDTRE